MTLSRQLPALVPKESNEPCWSSKKSSSWSSPPSAFAVAVICTVSPAFAGKHRLPISEKPPFSFDAVRLCVDIFSL